MQQNSMIQLLYNITLTLIVHTQIACVMLNKLGAYIVMTPAQMCNDNVNS